MKVKNILAVGLFAFFGGILRYLLSSSFSDAGILIANVVGSFILAFLTYYVIEKDFLAGWLDLGLGTGMIGAFTTFSSFATITINLTEQSFLVGLGYFLFSILGGFLAAFLGYLLAQLLIRL